MLRALTSGLSGLRTHQTKMDVIGNNIANVNTAGFKSSRVSFKDTFYQTLTGSSDANDVTGGGNPNQIGYGSNVATIDVLHTRGNFSSTGQAMDVFISGNGYFIARDGSGKERYTRTGIFNFDGDGNLVDGNRQFICGYPLDRYKSDVAGKSSTIKDPTTNADIVDFGLSSGEYFNGYRVRIMEDAEATATTSTVDTNTKTITVKYMTGAKPDAVGLQQALRQTKTVDPKNDFPTYVKNALQEITVATGYTLPAGNDVFTGVSGDGINSHKTGDVIFEVTPPTGAQIPFGNSNISFGDKNGALMNGYKIVLQASTDAAVATDTCVLDEGNKTITVTLQHGATDVAPSVLEGLLQKMNPGVGNFPAGFNPALIKITPDAASTAIAVGTTSTKIAGGIDQIVTTKLDRENGVQQIKVPGQMLDTDGNGVYDIETGGVMNLVGIQVGSDGIISAEAPNGTIIQVGQILLASIPNPQALTLEGNSYLTAVSNTGDIVYGIPGTEGTGPLVSGGVEGSNVDLANEFADMITTQRGFQANSRIFTVGDEMLQELINLKR